MCLIVLEDFSDQFNTFLQLIFPARNFASSHKKSFFYSREFFTANASYSIFLVVKLSLLCLSVNDYGWGENDFSVFFFFFTHLITPKWDNGKTCYTEHAMKPKLNEQHLLSKFLVKFLFESFFSYSFICSRVKKRRQEFYKKLGN